MDKELIKRTLDDVISRMFRFLPVITLTGPRQSGKTTLCRQQFHSLPYVNLEDAATLSEIQFYPKGFLAKYPEGLIIDEAQRYPDIFSYLQVAVDEDRMSKQVSCCFNLSNDTSWWLSSCLECWR